ncbi:MAG: hypothetical protein OTI36_13515 [Beijerinckiaceae bacterium]|nr:hypothetical protein [Beijerinckiaceae bacterium]
MPDAGDLSAEEWSLIHALRRVRQQGDLENAYRRVENEILDNVGATLDRMIQQADRTSAALDVLLRRLTASRLTPPAGEA